MKRMSVQKYVVGASLFVSLFVVQTTAVHAATTAALLPVGEGTNLAWTPSTSTVHYTTVDESLCNGVTDYVSTGTFGSRDSYQVSVASVPTSAVITGVSIVPCASRNVTGTGSSFLKVFYRLNGVASADAGGYSLLATTTPTPLSTTTIAGLSTTKNASTTLEVGVTLFSGTNGIRLSNIVTIISYVTSAPSAPTSLTAVATTSNTAVVLSWTDTSSEETNFIIERSTDNISFSMVATTSANVTSYLNSGLTDGTYYYRVKANNPIGSSANATTSIVLPLTAPIAPSSLSVVATSSLTAAALSWTDNSSNETGFVIERSTDNISFGVVGSTSVNVRTYTDTGLATGTYYYRVKAVNGGGSSAYATMSQPLVLTIPVAPSSLAAVALATSTPAVRLTWVDNSSNESQFVVERSTDNVIFGVVLTTSANVISITDSFGLASGTMYYYRVSARNVLGTSTPSGVASTTTF